MYIFMSFHEFELTELMRWLKMYTGCWRWYDLNLKRFMAIHYSVLIEEDISIEF